MYTILTLFKKDANIVKELISAPILPVMECFSTTMEMSGKYGSSFLTGILNFINQNGDYLEVHMEFIDENKYREWHDIFGEIHDKARAELDQYFRENGIVFARYFQYPDLADLQGSKNLSEFVPRNEILKQIPIDVNY
jgi:hypothetical protein